MAGKLRGNRIRDTNLIWEQISHVLSASYVVSNLIISKTADKLITVFSEYEVVISILFTAVFEYYCREIEDLSQILDYKKLRVSVLGALVGLFREFNNEDLGRIFSPWV